MSESEVTPRKQTRLEWSFKKGSDREERGGEGGEQEKPFAEMSPFKKLEEKLSSEEFRGFKRKLEAERKERANEQKAPLIYIAVALGRGTKGLCLGVHPADPPRNRYSGNR